MGNLPRIWRWRPSTVLGAMLTRDKSSSFNPDNWATREEDIGDANTLWRQYLILVDLYRYYVDLVWKVSVWYYTVLGVSLVWFLGHLNARNPGYLPLLLIFLSTLSGGLIAIFASTLPHLRETEGWLEYIAVSLRLPGRPHVEFILSFIRMSCCLFLLAALACLGLFAFIYLHA